MSIRLDALPELEVRWDATVSDSAGEGVDIEIADFGGFRTEADTAKILKFKQDDYKAYADAARAAGHVPIPITGPWDDGSSRPIAAYGESYHDFGGARDFTIAHYPSGMSYESAVSRVQAIAEANGLRSGHSYGDDPHLELRVTLPELQQMWAAYEAEGGTGAGGIGAGAALAILAIGLGSFVALRYVQGLKSWT
jgi:hypothetical protein